MTVNTVNIVSGPYSGNDVNDTFPYTFRVDTKNQLSVWETVVATGVETLLVVDTDYTVAGIGNDSGGDLTRVAGALPTGSVWYIRSNYIETQLVDFPGQGSFSPELHEQAADKLTFLIQQITDKTSRSVRFGDSYYGTVEPVLPSPEALKFLRWNAAADAVENVSGTVSVTAADVSYDNSDSTLTSANVKAALDELDSKAANSAADAVHWWSASAPEANAWNGVTYGGGTYVAVSSDGTNRVATSTNGITWTSRTAAAAETWSAVCYGNSLFVAVSASGKVMTSPDGITWTSRTEAVASQWSYITYGGGLYVAVADAGAGDRVMTSPDGITWTSRTEAEANAWKGIVYGNSLFVAVSSDGTNRVMTSPDGITWTARTSTAAANAVTYGGGTYTKVGAGGAVQTSPDAITWTSRTAAEVTTWNSVVYGNGRFVAASSSGTYRVMSSSDGITWTPRYAASDESWADMVWTGAAYVAVASSGTPAIMFNGTV